MFAIWLIVLIILILAIYIISRAHTLGIKLYTITPLNSINYKQVPKSLCYVTMTNFCWEPVLFFFFPAIHLE